jgi:hypothetical protein
MWRPGEAVTAVSCSGEDAAVPARAVGVWLSITSLARAEGAAVAIRHAVTACGEALGAEAALLLASDHRPYEPLFATGSRSDELTDLQATLGEGPAVEAGHGNGPVLGADLGTAGALVRWPEFAPAALARGVAAVFAVPVGSGAARVGVLCLYRERAQDLTRDQLDTLLLYADAAMVLALDERGGLGPGSAELIGSSFTERRAEVHQASGMISVQLDISVIDALVTLRARAFAEGRPIAQIAADVVARRLSFSGRVDGFPDGVEPGKTGQQPIVDGHGPNMDGRTPPANGQAPQADGQGPDMNGQAPHVDGQGPRAHGPAPPEPRDQNQDHDQNRADTNEETEGQ